MLIRNIFLTLALCLGWVASADASLSIAISDLSLAPGGTGTINVTAFSTGSDPLNFFAFRVQITPNSPTTTRLEFSPTQPNATTFANLNYVFFGNSFDEDNGFTLANTGTISDTNDGVQAADQTSDTNDVTVGASQLLLASLQVTASTGSPPQLGDTFKIALVDIGTNTFFGDSSANFTVPPAAFGTVTIASAVAATTPEPSSLLLGALACAGAAIAGWRSRRRA